jgi:hypothetical protein
MSEKVAPNVNRINDLQNQINIIQYRNGNVDNE